MALRKEDVAPPVARMEAVEVPELGGEVIVRALRLSDRLDLAINAGGSGAERMARMLSLSVVDAEQRPLWSADDWEVFGGNHLEAALRLFQVAQRLSGMGSEDAEKK